MTTTPQALYAALLTQLQTASSLSSLSAFVSVDGATVSIQGDRAAWIVPGAMRNLNPDAGGVGHVRVELQVVTLKRTSLDMGDQRVEAITDATLSVLTLVEQVRQVMHNFASSGVTIEPLRWLGGDAPRESGRMPGWVEVTDRYDGSYLMDVTGNLS